MTCEEPELLTDIPDFTTLFYVILRGRSSECLESSIKSDLHVGMGFAIWSLDLAIHNFFFLLQYLTLHYIQKLPTIHDFAFF